MVSLENYGREGCFFGSGHGVTFWHEQPPSAEQSQL
jgi:hypothetical protein